MIRRKVVKAGTWCSLEGWVGAAGRAVATGRPGPATSWCARASVVALPVAAVHHEAVTRLTPGTPLVIAALCVVLGAIHCGRSSPGPTGADAGGDGGSRQDGGAE